MVGFFKRILSLGSKKNSKRKQSQAARSNNWVDEVGAQVNPPQASDEDNEIAANLLLRSSSARYAVVAETDYTTLPPLRIWVFYRRLLPVLTLSLAHPINNAISTPVESTSSLPSPSVARSGTYIVKVHPRQRHSSTDFPIVSHATVEEPNTPQHHRRSQTTGEDSTHLQGLRRDPSVASLLDLYDEHGHLPIEAFSNTPPLVKGARKNSVPVRPCENFLANQRMVNVTTLAAHLRVIFRGPNASLGKLLVLDHERS